nr:MAG TPA: hypothetical protein [Inoviridae sp.]
MSVLQPAYLLLSCRLPIFFVDHYIGQDRR